MYRCFIVLLVVDLTCAGFPGPGHEGHCLAMNPIREYLHNSDSNCHIDNVFDSFKAEHGKNYKNDHEHTHRQHLFHNNLRSFHSFIHSLIAYIICSLFKTTSLRRSQPNVSEGKEQNFLKSFCHSFTTFSQLPLSDLTLFIS